jgi:hypothetical protein
MLHTEAVYDIQNYILYHVLHLLYDDLYFLEMWQCLVSATEWK